MKGEAAALIVAISDGDPEKIKQLVHSAHFELIINVVMGKDHYLPLMARRSCIVLRGCKGRRVHEAS